MNKLSTILLLTLPFGISFAGKLTEITYTLDQASVAEIKCVDEQQKPQPVSFYDTVTFKGSISSKNGKLIYRDSHDGDKIHGISTVTNGKEDSEIYPTCQHMTGPCAYAHQTSTVDFQGQESLTISDLTMKANIYGEKHTLTCNGSAVFNAKK